MQALLRKGMDALSQTEVGSALQIFFNLQLLEKVSFRACSFNLHSLLSGWQMLPVHGAMTVSQHSDRIASPACVDDSLMYH